MSGGRVRYLYTDEDERPVAFKERVPRPGEGKAFFPHHQDDAGTVVHEGVRFSSGLPTPELKATLYRLPEVAAVLAENRKPSRVFWTEGERDADSVAALGETATTVLQSGAEHVVLAAQRFAGFRGRVTVVTDQDPAGYAQALCKREALEALGVRVEVKAPRGDLNDLTDHLSAGLTLNQLVPVVALKDKAGRHDPTQPGNGSTWPPHEGADEPGADGTDDELTKAVAAERFRARVRREARRQDDLEAAGAAFAGFARMPLSVALQEAPDESPWLIRDVMRVGHKVGLVAGFKTGKTTLLGNVARSVVDGVPLFDRFEVADVGGSVVIFDFELVGRDALDMYRRLDIRNAHRVHVEALRGQRFSLANDVHAEMVVRFLRDREAAVWMLDPFARAMRGFGSENDNDDVGTFLQRVDQIVADTGVQGVVIPAHTGRGLAEVGTEHSRGATRFDDDVDARWIYTRDGSGQRFFRAEGRNGIGKFGEFAVRWDAARDALSSTEDTRKSVAVSKNAEAAHAVVKGWQPAPGADETRPCRRDVYEAMPHKDRQTNQAGVDEAIRLGWLVEEKTGRGRPSFLSLGKQSPTRRKLNARPVPDEGGEAS